LQQLQGELDKTAQMKENGTTAPEGANQLPTESNDNQKGKGA
jgi:hypothetical protein